MPSTELIRFFDTNNLLCRNNIEMHIFLVKVENRSKHSLQGYSVSTADMINLTCKIKDLDTDVQE